MDRLRSDPPDWSCFYYAKQYREECSDYNRLAGGDYIDRVCANLEAKLHACEQNLAKEIANCQPYAEDAPIEVENMQPWLRRPAGIRSA
ncbi:proline-tRNA ligase [Babesia caballi]|uniref:Proline-tRNA ligase n=1 Tax=Babesia caballi TaxID=5871 RepID=A0AAV4LZW8_BABCB|nr:proline-tRNA ligase [Babesia caballi]